MRAIDSKGKRNGDVLEATNLTKLDTIIEEYINLNFINYNLIHLKANKRSTLALNENPLESLKSR